MIRPKTVRGVILDVDGTLVDSNDAHAHAWVLALEQGGHQIRFDQVRPLIGMGGDKIIPRLTGLAPHGASARLISERRRHIFAQAYMLLLRPQPGARHLVLALKERGLSVAVASSAEESELAGLLRLAEVDGLVEHVVSKDEAGGHSKPDADAVAAALEFIDLPAEEVVMIGDTPYDIEAAAKVGIGTIALRCGGFSSQDLADALAVYKDPQDLTNDLEQSPIVGRHAA
jgi:HAD superfamily hydrolase (TIGR01509 family)